jgi:hypothetical protein
MKDTLYANLVELIDSRRTWIKVIDHTRTAKLKPQPYGERPASTCRILTLMATSQRGVFDRGHVWDITEHKLDLAVRSLKHRDKYFALRCNSGVMTVADAEYLIRHASNKFINLNLVEELS